MKNYHKTAELLRYIDYHVRSESHLVNSINGIISDSNFLEEIIKVMNILKTPYVSLHYSDNTDAENFLNSLNRNLLLGKTVLIIADTLNFNSLIYDQLINFRDENMFTMNLKSADYAANRFPSRSKIFLYCRNSLQKDDIYQISNHVLNLREVN
jgi:hypothetical protein